MCDRANKIEKYRIESRQAEDTTCTQGRAVISMAMKM